MDPFRVATPNDIRSAMARGHPRYHHQSIIDQQNSNVVAGGAQMKVASSATMDPNYARVLQQQQQYRAQQQQQAAQQTPGTHNPPGGMHGAHIGGPAPSYQQYMAQRNTQAPAATSAAAVGARYPPHNPQLRHAMPGQAQPPVPPGSYPNPVPATIPEKTPYQSEVQKVEQERAEHEAAFARAFMPTDLSLPEGIDEVIPFPDMIEACNYKLQVSEERAAIIRRKFAEYHERFFHGSRAHLNYETLVPGNWKAHRSHKLHLRISNTCENQPWQYDALEENAFDFDSGVDPKYKVTIEGCLVPDAEDEKEWDDLNTIWPEEWKDTDDEAEDEDEAERDGMTDGPAADKSAAAENGEEITAAISAKDDNGKDKAANGAEPRKRKTKHIKPEPKPLAYFFKRMSVEYDRPAALQPDGFKAINWEKPDIPPQVRELPLVARCRSWAFERKGDENMSVTIKLWRDEKPEVFRLSDPLAEMLASRYATREEIMSGMWEYVKLMKCHRDPTSKRVACNDDMKAVFNSDTLYYPNLANEIEKHLSPEEPLELPYTIRVDPESATVKPTEYCIRVHAPTPLEGYLERLFTPTQRVRAIYEAAVVGTAEQAAYLEQLRGSIARHRFFSAFARDPVGFLRRFVASQRRDLAVIRGEERLARPDGWVGDEFRRGGTDGVWGSDAVREAVGLMVAKPPGRG